MITIIYHLHVICLPIVDKKFVHTRYKGYERNFAEEKPKSEVQTPLELLTQRLSHSVTGSALGLIVNTKK